MTKSLKAALLSGLVVPGAGQIFLHRYRRGIALMVLVLGGLVSIIVNAVRTALAIVEQMETLGGDMDVAAISRLVHQSTTSTGAWYYGSLLLIACCWIFAIVDAYRTGKREPDQTR